MNLTIAPVSVSKTHLKQNYTNNNNNCRNQNFGALQTRVTNKIGYPRDLDYLVDTFLLHFEKICQKVGINTEKLNKQGYKLEIDAKDYDFYGDINTRLLDKNDKLVQNNCHPSKGMEEQTAKEFVNNIANKLKLSA